MTTIVNIAVEGTCTAGPDDNLLELLEQISRGERERARDPDLMRNVSGGATTLWVKSPEGIYVIDSGDHDDRGVLETSLGELQAEEHVPDARKAVQAVYPTHLHPDHIGNNDLFKGAKWYVIEGDDLVDMLGREKKSDYAPGFRDLYAGHRKRGITPAKFTALDNGEVLAMPGRKLAILNTPGHAKVHLAYIIEDDEVIVRSMERGTENKTNRVIAVGDCLCTPEYLKRFMSGKPNKSVYGNAIPSPPWLPQDQAKRACRDMQNLCSIFRIVGDVRDNGGLMIFGHAGVYDPKEIHAPKE
jgi:glyoxylase-like metal-dependent hydrolase (beta-lactamase superfamily II)